MTVDITIVTYNSTKDIKKCIESIVQQKVPLEQLAVYVYDNASTDGSADAARVLLEAHADRFREVKVIAGDENVGFGAGHNKAATEGEGDYLFILNPDTELAPDCLEKLLARAEGASDSTAAWEPRQSPYEHPKWYHPVTYETEWCSGAALLVRRAAFEEIKGFDPALFLYCEDVDLSWRLRIAGFSLRYVPDAVLHHYSYVDPAKTKMAMFFGNARGNMALRIRYGSWRNIARGLLMHAELIIRPKMYLRGRDRFLLFKGVVKAFLKFPHFRKHGEVDSKRFLIRGWDYGRRLGNDTMIPADNSAGLALTKHPKVSVLIRTMGNRNDLLREAIQSVMHQTYPTKSIEIVLVQDGKANLGRFVKEFEGIAIQYKALGSNKGRCAAGNLAMEMATGTYCVFLDDDDMFFADHLEQLVATAEANKADVAYAYGWELSSEYSHDGRRILREGMGQVTYDEPVFSFARLLTYNFLPINCVLFKKACFEKCGGFDEELDFLEDWDLWLRFAYQFRPFALMPKVTSMYRVPMTISNLEERDARFKEYRHKVRMKHDHNELTISTSDLRQMYEDLQRSSKKSSG